MHPDRYNRPTENQIQKVVTALCTEEKKMRKRAAQGRVQDEVKRNEKSEEVSNANSTEGSNIVQSADQWNGNCNEVIMGNDGGITEVRIA